MWQMQVVIPTHTEIGTNIEFWVNGYTRWYHYNMSCSPRVGPLRLHADHHIILNYILYYISTFEHWRDQDVSVYEAYSNIKYTKLTVIASRTFCRMTLTFSRFSLQKLRCLMFEVLHIIHLSFLLRIQILRHY